MNTSSVLSKPQTSGIDKLKERTKEVAKTTKEAKVKVDKMDVAELHLSHQASIKVGAMFHKTEEQLKIWEYIGTP